MQAPVCCQEPIILVEGPWAEGQFCDIDYLECPFRYLFLFQPSGAAVPELPFCAGFCCPPCTLLLPASTLLAVVLWDLMDLLGSVRRDGLSTLASLPLCRFLPPTPRRGNSCRVLVQAKLVSPFLWITAVPYMLLVFPEGVFIVTNCMLAFA